MLAERRRLLDQLMKLDDDMLEQLVRVRGQHGPGQPSQER
jgi:hypothetical protein